MTDKIPSAQDKDKSDEKSDDNANNVAEKNSSTGLHKSTSNDNMKNQKKEKEKEDDVSVVKNTSKHNVGKDGEDLGSKNDISRGLKPQSGRKNVESITKSISKRSANIPLKNSDSGKNLGKKKSPKVVAKIPAIVLPEPESAADQKKKEILKNHPSKTEIQAKKEKVVNKMARLSNENDDSKADRSKEKEKVKIKENENVKENEKAKVTEREKEVFQLKLKFETPEDEVDLALLQLDSATVGSLRLMEEYRWAMGQVHLLITNLMRKGNETTDLENIRSEKNTSKPEKLYKDTVAAAIFWNDCPEFQPMLFSALKQGCNELGSAERYMQDHGPKRMARLRKFLYKHWPVYANYKREVLKLVQKEKPELKPQIEEVVKKMMSFAKQRYAEMKYVYLAEIQCATGELEHYYRQSEKIWACIAEKKISKRFKPEPFDVNQISK